MRKWTKANSETDNKKIQKVTAENVRLSGAATKAMFSEMAAICLAMGANFGVYIPIAPLCYENPPNNF